MNDLRGTYALLVLASFSLSQPAKAQRADENATVQAGDAFGFSLGGESVGIYNAGEVRGLSPTAAGNVRINGLYFDQQTDLPDKLIDSTAIRVGLSALDFDLPSPSGIVDQTLRIPERTVVTTSAGLGDFLAPYVSVEGGWVNASKTLAVGYGAGIDIVDKFETGATSRSADAALLVHARASDDVAVTVYGGRFWYFDDEDRISIYLDPALPPQLPPEFPRRVAYNQPWGEGSGNGTNFGGILNAALAPGWGLKVGAFWSQFDPALNFEELYLDTQPDGRAIDQMIIVNPGNVFRSFSGEARLTRSFVAGSRIHDISLSVRGRVNHQQYGGDFDYLIGPRRLGVRELAPEPVPVFGAQVKDDVRQVAGALSYRLGWKGVGILNLGLQKVHFEKTVDDPGSALGPQTGTSHPLLFNASLALELGRSVILFGGYARGLEESGTAPRNAANADQVLPVVLTTQRDIGLRLAIAPKTTLIAALFDVRKPFPDINTGNGNRFEFIGERHNRGVEVSFNSQPVKGLSLVVGALFVDPHLSGPNVRGSRAVGTIGRNVQSSINYDIAAVPGLSVGGYVTHYGKWIASRDNQLTVPSRTVLDLNMRYRFDRWGARHRVRVGIGNVFNKYGWRVNGDGSFQYNAKRRVSFSLTSDW